MTAPVRVRANSSSRAAADAAAAATAAADSGTRTSEEHDYDYDYLFVGAFLNYKRPLKLLEKRGRRLAVGKQDADAGPEAPAIARSGGPTRRDVAFAPGAAIFRQTGDSAPGIRSFTTGAAALGLAFCCPTFPLNNCDSGAKTPAAGLGVSSVR